MEHILLLQIFTLVAEVSADGQLNSIHTEDAKLVRSHIRRFADFTTVESHLSG